MTFITYWLIGYVCTVVYEFMFSEPVKKFPFGQKIIFTIVNLIVWPLLAAASILELIMPPELIEKVKEMVERERDD